jgi:hypothetical protein
MISLEVCRFDSITSARRGALLASFPEASRRIRVRMLNGRVRGDEEANAHQSPNQFSTISVEAALSASTVQ